MYEKVGKISRLSKLKPQRGKEFNYIMEDTEQEDESQK